LTISSIERYHTGSKIAEKIQSLFSIGLSSVGNKHVKVYVWSIYSVAKLPAEGRVVTVVIVDTVGVVNRVVVAVLSVVTGAVVAVVVSGTVGVVSDPDVTVVGLVVDSVNKRQLCSLSNVWC